MGCLARTLFSLSIILIQGAPAAAQNVVLVSFDDVGIDKVAAYGFPNPAPTPNVDALAAAGVTFRNAWAYPVCAPSRAATLTGLRASINGVGTNPSITNPTPNNTVGLDAAIPNIASVLKSHGYRTAAVGKWHLSGFDTTQNIIDHPNASGFDFYAGTLSGPKVSATGLTTTGYFQWEHCVNGTCSLSTDYLTSVATDEAIEQLGGSEPFFLYVPYNSAHDPPHDPPAHLHSFAGQCAATAPPSTPTCHKAMTQSVDSELGRLMSAVDLSDTTVIFLGDNGSPKTTVEYPFDTEKAKGTLYQGGINVPFIVAGDAVASLAEGQVSEALVGVTDIFATIMEITGFADGTPDSISFAKQLSNPWAPSERQVLLSETFVPNGGPPNPGGHRRAAREARYKLLKIPGDPAEFYDLDVDPFEQSPLDALSLNVEQAEAFNRLAPWVGASSVPEPGSTVATGAGIVAVILLEQRRNARRSARSGGSIACAQDPDRTDA